MESTSLKNAKLDTLVIDSIRFQSKATEVTKFSENFNPNFSHSNPLTNSKSAQSNTKLKPNSSSHVVFSPRSRIRERRFVVAKNKNSTKEKKDSTFVDCKTNGNIEKWVCIANETLRDSQEDFLDNRRESQVETGESSQNVEEDEEVGESNEIEVSVKKRREKVLEEARRNLPEHGRVRHLVKAFEKLTCFPFSKATYKSGDGNQTEDKIKKAVKWELPGMSLQKPKCQEVSWHSSFSPSDLLITATNLGLEQPRAAVSSLWDNSVNSNGGRRNRRNSLESCASMGTRRSKKKQIKVTSLKPFLLRTEERGRIKEEELTKKLQELTMEEEKMRIPIAQGLPWTTDNPENLVKPHVKDITMPVDLKLHSDIRAVERAEFDYQVSEKISLIEQYRAERERQEKLAEEEEIRRLRKELIPKAQPMPYFDRPFIPKRSNKHPTIPRDPKFNIPRQKKSRCCSTSSWSEIGSYINDVLYQHDL